MHVEAGDQEKYLYFVPVGTDDTKVTVPESPPDEAATRPSRHVVHLYETDVEIVLSVANAFQAAIEAGQATLLVATPDHRQAIEDELRERGLVLHPGAHRAFDATETLESLLIDGAPDWSLFRAVVGTVVAELAFLGEGLCVYGEMVGVLWQRGQATSAMRLEGFWNVLGREVAFFLLCGYRTDKGGVPSEFDAVCRLHSDVIH